MGTARPRGLERTLFSPVLQTQIKNKILGKRFDVSFAFISPREMRKAMIYRYKDSTDSTAVSNVLSFKLSDTSGEILICKSTARAQCKAFGMDYETFLAYLFIHGLFHIRGLNHGATMEDEERRIMRRFNLRAHEQSSNRN